MITMNAKSTILISLSLIVVLSARMIGQSSNVVTPQDPACNEVLGRPTDQSITLSVLSSNDIESCVEYGRTSGTYTDKTITRIVRKGVPFEFEIEQLSANTRYYYRLLFRPSGSKDFAAKPEGMFHTQRSSGSTFTFALQGDSHPERPGKMYDSKLYATTMNNVTQDKPDFYLTLGDDFSIERPIEKNMLSQSNVDQVYAQQRPFLGVVGRSSALFLVNGNHEQAARYLLDGTENNASVLAGRARTRFYPLPAPGKFYSGDADEVENVGLLRDYYSWTWGDALFVVIDPYWHSPKAVDNEAGVEGKGKRGGGKEGTRDGTKERGNEGKREGQQKRDLWETTMGDAQYRWLTKTLTESKARWKFVFCHHVLGTGRGGVEMASLSEWGGKDKRGVSSFAEKRPGWEFPIHDLMVKSGVTILFQGHDHLYARQELDGIVYQSCPNPADQTYQAFNREAYRSGNILPNSGHLRVTVAPESVRVDYVRSFLSADEGDGKKNAGVAASYTILTKSKGASK